MDRREFLINAGIVSMSPLFLPDLLSFAQSMPQGYSRSFALEEKLSAGGMPAQGGIQGLIPWADQLYILHNIGDTKTFGLSCVTSTGLLKWTWKLPKGYFQGPIVRSSESIFLYHWDRQRPKDPPEILEYGDDGVLLRRIAVTRTPRAFCLSAEFLVGVYPDGSAEVSEITGDLSRPAVLVNIHPRFVFFDVEAIEENRIAVIDKVLARLVTFDVSGHATPPSSIECPEVNHSLDFYAKQQRAMLEELARQGRPDVRPGSAMIVPATCSDGSGGLYCLISPVDPNRALILKVGGRGQVLQSTRLILPDRSTKPSKMPTRLCVLRDELLIVFPEGDVVAYQTS